MRRQKRDVTELSDGPSPSQCTASPLTVPPQAEEDNSGIGLILSLLQVPKSPRKGAGPQHSSDCQSPQAWCVPNTPWPWLLARRQARLETQAKILPVPKIYLKSTLLRD